jgi:hypothetical protein
MRIPSNIIVQAGGKGTRLGIHTQNKPKCLVSIQGKPLLYHLFELYPHSDYYIIVDHQADIVEKYLNVVPPSCNFKVIKAKGTGTLSGIHQSLSHISKNEDILLVWCDLLLKKDFLNCESLDVNSVQIGLSRTFICRWSLNEDKKLVEITSDQRGVAGYFRFPSKRILSELPESGEFVRWLSHKEIDFQEIFLDETLEIGTIKAYEEAIASQTHTRFFNKLEFQQERIIKYCTYPDYEYLITNEGNWYNYVQSKNYQYIPKIYSTNPLTLEKINGYHPFELTINESSQIQNILHSAINALQELHEIEKRPAGIESVKSNYIEKTRKRVESVVLLIQGFELETITINGLDCRNPFHERNSWILEQTEKYLLATQRSFCPIHGDPTFSNMLYSINREEVVLFDPRGYFGNSKIFGDPDYDWAKLYYSVVGNYDAFNRRKFVLYDKGLGDYIVDLKHSNYHKFATELLKHIPNPCRLELIHALIWLSLTSYAIDDVDSVRAAFYLGIYYLERMLTKYNWFEMSCLPKTWFIDVDGVLVKHNGHLEGNEQWLEGSLEFLSHLSQEDKIILTTSRQEKDLKNLREKLEAKGIKIDLMITELGHGERIIINDKKISGLRTAFSISLDRDLGMNNIVIVNNPNL